MVVPCYDEAPDFISRWQAIYSDTSLLIVLVLNRPEGGEHTANEPVRKALAGNTTKTFEQGYSLSQLNNACSVLCVDLEILEGPTPAKEGVGRARRIGCDLALQLQQTGAINTAWIYSGDADAIWPADLFNTTWPDEASAVAVPFSHRFDNADKHQSPSELAIARATQLYELKIHHYALHLQAINSPYGFHTLGSSCLFKASAYAAVRGMPLRSAAEDFYLLNKLAKVGPVHGAQGNGVTITPRLSTRVPFGTRTRRRKNCWQRKMSGTNPCSTTRDALTSWGGFPSYSMPGPKRRKPTPSINWWPNSARGSRQISMRF